MANRIKITNLVNQHKRMAESFLEQLIESGAVPGNFSGVLTPKFGNMLFTWQFQKTKLVGSVAIHVNNIPNYRAKLAAGAAGMDFLAPKIEVKEDIES